MKKVEDMRKVVIFLKGYSYVSTKRRLNFTKLNRT